MNNEASTSRQLPRRSASCTNVKAQDVNGGSGRERKTSQKKNMMLMTQKKAVHHVLANLENYHKMFGYGSPIAEPLFLLTYEIIDLRCIHMIDRGLRIGNVWQKYITDGVKRLLAPPQKPEEKQPQQKRRRQQQQQQAEEQHCDEHLKLQKIFCDKYHMLLDKGLGVDRRLLALVELRCRLKYADIFNLQTGPRQTE